MLPSLRRTPEKSQKVFASGCFNLFVAILLAVWSELDDSLSTWCLSIVLFFNFFACLCSLISQRLGTDALTESKSQATKYGKSDDDLDSSTSKNVSYSFGYARIEVLATFSACCVAQLGAFSIAKEAAERLVYTSTTETRFTLLSACAFSAAHAACWCLALRNRPPFSNAMNESPSSVLQEQATVLFESMASTVPSFATRYCLPRIDAFALLGILVVVLQCISTLATRTYSSSIADNLVGVAMSAAIFCTMLPILTHCATILLQTTPTHVAGQLDAALREASTIDGVLEFRNEHFWTVAFRRRLVGSLHIRIRRDANEAAIVRAVRDKLSPFIADLTVHVTKDRFAVPTVGGQHHHLQSPFIYTATAATTAANLPQAAAVNHATGVASFGVHASTSPITTGTNLSARMEQGLPDLVQPFRVTSDSAEPGFNRPADRPVSYL